jgi:hypothetical protein
VAADVAAVVGATVGTVVAATVGAVVGAVGAAVVGTAGAAVVGCRVGATGAAHAAMAIKSTIEIAVRTYLLIMERPPSSESKTRTPSCSNSLPANSPSALKEIEKCLGAKGAQRHSSPLLHLDRSAFRCYNDAISRLLRAIPDVQIRQHFMTVD